MRQFCDAEPTRCDHGPAKQRGHQNSLEHAFTVTRGKKPRDSIGKEKTDRCGKQVRRNPPDYLLTCV